MEILKKKHKEIIALYKLEKDIKDIYVEGNSDKVFLENYLRFKRNNKKIILIEVVDFSELNPAYTVGYDLTSNRNKTLILSKLLAENIPLTEVRCIVDKDFDDYIKTISNPKLFITDFSCLESYLFCEEVINKFLNIGINNFPFDSKMIIDQLSSVLKPLFCLRLLRELHFPSTKLVDIDGNLAIDKKTGTINFNPIDYLNKFISKNSLTKRSNEIISSYQLLYNKLSLEIRDNMNGHDFMKIFFLYINKVKNTTNYKEENFCKTLFLTVEMPMIEKYKLFKDILV